MRMENALSVVMAVCNGEPYLEEQIASILCQLDDEDELIISLDPSTDGSQVVLEGLEDKRVRLLCGPGKGVAANFEWALLHVRKPLVALADQDDVWLPGKVKAVRQAFTNSAVTVLVHDCQVVDENLQLIQPSYFQSHGTKAGLAANWMRNSYIGCCMAFRASLLTSVLPFPAHIPMHDQWIGLIGEARGHTLWLPEPLLLYRRHTANASSLSPSPIGKQVRWRAGLLAALAGRLIFKTARKDRV